MATHLRDDEHVNPTPPCACTCGCKNRVLEGRDVCVLCYYRCTAHQSKVGP